MGSTFSRIIPTMLFSRMIITNPLEFVEKAKDVIYFSLRSNRNYNPFNPFGFLPYLSKHKHNELYLYLFF